MILSLNRSDEPLILPPLKRQINQAVGGGSWCPGRTGRPRLISASRLIELALVPADAPPRPRDLRTSVPGDAMINDPATSIVLNVKCFRETVLLQILSFVVYTASINDILMFNEKQMHSIGTDWGLQTGDN